MNNSLWQHTTTTTTKRVVCDKIIARLRGNVKGKIKFVRNFVNKEEASTSY